MKKLIIGVMICMTMGCSARQGAVTTLGFVAAGVAGAVGMDPFIVSDAVEDVADGVADSAEEAKKERLNKEYLEERAD